MLKLVKREAIIFSIPFLFELLATETTKDKELLIHLIWEILRYKEQLAEANLTAQEIVQYRQYAQRIYLAICEGIRLFQELVEDSDPALKLAAADLLEELASYD